MNYLKKTALTILVIFLVSFSQETIGQPPPPPSGGHGQSGNQSGGGAPIGSGLFILLSLGAAYGGKKLYNLREMEEK